MRRQEGADEEEVGGWDGMPAAWAVRLRDGQSAGRWWNGLVTLGKRRVHLRMEREREVRDAVWDGVEGPLR